MINVRVIFGTGFGGMAGPGSEVLELEKPTLAGLAQALMERHGASLRSSTGGRDQKDVLEGLAVLVNGVNARSDIVLKDGDEIAIFLVAAGG